LIRIVIKTTYEKLINYKEIFLMTCTNYALVYEKDGKFFGSTTGIPTENDTDLKITREQVEGYKLVYATKTEIRGSMTGIPSEDDTVIYAIKETTEEENASGPILDAGDEPVAEEEEE
jgi:hypothetical protein